MCTFLDVEGLLDANGHLTGDLSSYEALAEARGLQQALCKVPLPCSAPLHPTVRGGAPTPPPPLHTAGRTLLRWHSIMLPGVNLNVVELGLLASRAGTCMHLSGVGARLPGDFVRRAVGGAGVFTADQRGGVGCRPRLLGQPTSGSRPLLLHLPFPLHQPGGA